MNTSRYNHPKQISLMVWSFNKTHIFLWWTHAWWKARSVAAGLPSSMWPSPILSLQHLAAPNKRRSDGWSDRQAALFASMTIDFRIQTVYSNVFHNIYIYIILCDMCVYIYVCFDCFVCFKNGWTSTNLSPSVLTVVVSLFCLCCYMTPRPP